MDRAVLLSAALILSASTGAAQEPWGVSSSASGFRNHAEWFPKMTEAGITSVRLFPEWRGVEPKPGVWKWDDADLLVQNAAKNKIEITGILMGSPPSAKAIHAFPMDDLPGWSKFVSESVGRYKSSIRYWEVWNEGNGGFNDGKHTTSDYAKLAAATYDAAKKANPDARIGLTVASFDAPYLRETIRAMAKAGTPDRFDFLCIHPYEIADGLAEPDGEVPFLWMGPTLRAMLAEAAPNRANAPIWITEVGRRIEKGKVTDADAARDIVKIYVMALASGIPRTQWFESQDPVGEDQGFGLLARDGSPRGSFVALKKLISVLGPKPVYEGWLALGKDGRGYGFVFTGKSGPALVAWMPKGLSDSAVSLPGGKMISLSDGPSTFGELSDEAVKQARANAKKPFPWGGDFSRAKSVSTEAGITPTRIDRPVVKFPDGTSGVLLEGDINHPISFRVHPSFASLATREYHVRVTIRRVAAGNVGMNLLYEVADSQGRGPYANTGKWFGSTPNMGWQAYTWTIKDASFSKMWGHDFVIRPEQSVPFVLGKVEVSTEPFK